MTITFDKTEITVFRDSLKVISEISNNSKLLQKYASLMEYDNEIKWHHRPFLKHSQCDGYGCVGCNDGIVLRPCKCSVCLGKLLEPSEDLRREYKQEVKRIGYKD